MICGKCGKKIEKGWLVIHRTFFDPKIEGQNKRVYAAFDVECLKRETEEMERIVEALCSISVIESPPFTGEGKR